MPSVSPTPGRPESQPINRHADDPGDRPQDPVDDGQRPGHDQQQDSDEAAVIAALTDDDYLWSLLSHCSCRMRRALGPAGQRRPRHPGARIVRADRLSRRLHPPVRPAHHRLTAAVRRRPQLDRTSVSRCAKRLRSARLRCRRRLETAGNWHFDHGSRVLLRHVALSAQLRYCRPRLVASCVLPAVGPARRSVGGTRRAPQPADHP